MEMMINNIQFFNNGGLVGNELLVRSKLLCKCRVFISEWLWTV